MDENVVTGIIDLDDLDGEMQTSEEAIASILLDTYNTQNILTRDTLEEILLSYVFDDPNKHLFLGLDIRMYGNISEDIPLLGYITGNLSGNVFCINKTDIEVDGHRLYIGFDFERIERNDTLVVHITHVTDEIATLIEEDMIARDVFNSETIDNAMSLNHLAARNVYASISISLGIEDILYYYMINHMSDKILRDILTSLSPVAYNSGFTLNVEGDFFDRTKPPTTMVIPLHHECELNTSDFVPIPIDTINNRCEKEETIHIDDYFDLYNDGKEYPYDMIYGMMNTHNYVFLLYVTDEGFYNLQSVMYGFPNHTHPGLEKVMIDLMDEFWANNPDLK